MKTAAPQRWTVAMLGLALSVTLLGGTALGMPTAGHAAQKPGVAFCGEYARFSNGSWRLFDGRRTSLVRPKQFTYGCFQEFGISGYINLKWKRYTKKRAKAKATIQWFTYPEGSLRTVPGVTFTFKRPRAMAEARPVRRVFSRMKVSNTPGLPARLTGKFKAGGVKSQLCRFGYTKGSPWNCP